MNEPAIARAMRYFVSGSIIFSINGSIYVSVEAFRFGSQKIHKYDPNFTSLRILYSGRTKFVEYTYKSSLQVNRQIDDYRWKLSIRRALDGAEAYTPLIQ